MVLVEQITGARGYCRQVMQNNDLGVCSIGVCLEGGKPFTEIWYRSTGGRAYPTYAELRRSRFGR